MQLMTTVHYNLIFLCLFVERNSSTQEANSVSAGSVRTRAAKRKASPDTGSPRKRTKGPETEVPKNKEEDLRVRVLKRKFREEEEGLPKKKRPFYLARGDKESSSSSAQSSNDPLEGCSTSEDDGSKRRANKRKAVFEGDGPKPKRKRSPDLKKDKEDTTQNLTVDPLSE